MVIDISICGKNLTLSKVKRVLCVQACLNNLALSSGYSMNLPKCQMFFEQNLKILAIVAVKDNDFAFS